MQTSWGLLRLGFYLGHQNITPVDGVFFCDALSGNSSRTFNLAGWDKLFLGPDCPCQAELPDAEGWRIRASIAGATTSQSLVAAGSADVIWNFACLIESRLGVMRVTYQHIGWNAAASLCIKRRTLNRPTFIKPIKAVSMPAMPCRSMVKRLLQVHAPKVPYLIS